MKLLKLIVLIIGMLASMIVATFSSVYMLTGFSKAEYMKAIDKIPAENFGWLLVPTLLCSFGVAVYLWYKMIEISHSNAPPGHVKLRDFVKEHLRDNALHVEK